MTPIDFEVTWSKVKVKLFVLIFSAVYSISHESRYESRSNYQLQTLEKQHLKNSSLTFVFCHQFKQIKLSIAFNLLNHQFETTWHICNPLNFAPGGIYVSQTFLVPCLIMSYSFQVEWIWLFTLS